MKSGKRKKRVGQRLGQIPSQDPRGRPQRAASNNGTQVKQGLQCQNCGLIFLDDTVGAPRAAGCNPYTISDFDVSDGMITVAAEELSKAVPLFANWKVFE